jgi:hypothetical protein
MTFTNILLLILILLTAYLAYQYGVRKGNSKTKETIILHAQIVRNIAEIATLEVKGVNEYYNNDFDNNSWYGSLRNLFVGRNIMLKVPYTAKYGVALQNKKYKQTFKENDVLIILPEPELLSYEAHINEMQISTQLGILLEENSQNITSMQKQLYNDSKAQLQQDTAALSLSKKKIFQMFQHFYEPMGVNVHIQFNNNLIENKNDLLINQ